MKITLVTLFSVFCMCGMGQTYLEDSVLIEIEQAHSTLEFDYSPADGWKYFMIPDTLTITITRSQPALSSCGSFEFAEIIYGTNEEGMVRLLIPCGQTTECEIGSEMDFIQARPKGRVSDHEFRTDDDVARQHVTEIKRTAWAQVVQ
jgi:hypothetical protein